MTLRLSQDLSPADWIAHSDLPWDRLVTFGPTGFAAYARLRFLPDPTHPGQSENDVERDWTTDQLPILFEVLATQTTTPDACWFCLWDGYGDHAPQAPKLELPNRAYWLFHGPLAEAGDFGSIEPAFVWPADHAWCVAKDVDPHWAGIGGTRALVEQLVTDPRLDVVKADPTQTQPSYR